VRALPTFILFLNGQEKAMVRGADAAKLRAAIEEHKPIGGMTLSWGAPEPSAPAVADDDKLVPFASLAADLKAHASAIMSVTSCSPAVAAAMIQKHKGDVNAATMEVLTEPGSAEEFARAHLRAAPVAGRVSASAVAALGHTAGSASAGAAEPITTGGAQLQFRMAAKPTVTTKAMFDKSATVGAVAAWLHTRLPAGASFVLYTRKGSDEVPLDTSRTLEDEGLFPRGLVLVKDCAAPSFI
jgi:hypothetical protein